MNYRYGDVARSMEELPELLGRLEQLRFVEWDTHGAWLVVLGSESRGQHPADIDEVIGNDSETHPAMHARVTFIETTAKSVASLEHADAPFATDAPFLSFAEPALLLTLSPLHTLGAEKRTGDLCNPQLLRRRLVGGREKSGVAGRHARHHAEPLLMLFHRWDQQGRVRGPFIINLVGDDDLVFRLLNFDHFAELGGLARFSFADDFAGVFKQTDYLILPAELVTPWMIRASVGAAGPHRRAPAANSGTARTGGGRGRADPRPASACAFGRPRSRKAP